MDAKEIIGRWPSRHILAEDTGREYVTINSWYMRNRIPGDVDVDLVSAARKRRIKLTYEELARARAKNGAAL